MRESVLSNEKSAEDALLSQVLMALAKCPPSICAQSDVKSLFRRTATGSDCFGAAFLRAVVLEGAALVLVLVGGFAADLGGMVDVENVGLQR